jgi:hypothetical protein
MNIEQVKWESWAKGVSAGAVAASFIWYLALVTLRYCALIYGCAR